jgi:hypothetical protein
MPLACKFTGTDSSTIPTDMANHVMSPEPALARDVAFCPRKSLTSGKAEGMNM